MLGKIRKELNSLVQTSLEGVRLLGGNLSSRNGNGCNEHTGNRRNTEHDNHGLLALVNAKVFTALSSGGGAAAASARG